MRPVSKPLFAFVLLAISVLGCGGNGSSVPGNESGPTVVPETASTASVSSGAATVESANHRARIVIGGPQPLAGPSSEAHRMSLGPVAARATQP